MSERVGETSPLNADEEREIVEAHARATKALADERAQTAALREKIERTRAAIDSAATSAIRNAEDASIRDHLRIALAAAVVTFVVRWFVGYLF